ncbi:MAG: glycosyltransferase family 2 protein [Lachnospiraceae bacterium]|nr:glycosyltransferase family 2 protein [Lachnospiraceae bacterium]MDE7240056.1 glycosyltransferase family 2 protein [Lachnospiraceae bacterium]
MDELVSVVIPTYNREKSVVKALESVLEQEYSNVEILICDDFSTDGTKDVIMGFAAKDSRVRLLSRKDKKKGANAARNLGIESARGEYIAFLDSDDVMLRNGITARLKAFEQHPEVDMVYGDVMVGGERAEYDRIQKLNQHQYLMEELSLCCTNSIMVRKSVFQEVPLLDLEQKSWQDDALVLMLDKHKKKMYHCGEAVSEIKEGEERITANYKNLYEGVRRIVKLYRRDILKEKSIFRVLLWQLRIWRNWAYYKWRGGAKRALWFYHAVFLVCDDICVHHFRHIWG